MSDYNYVIKNYQRNVKCQSSEIVSQLCGMLGSLPQEILNNVKHLLIIQRFICEYLGDDYWERALKNLGEHRDVDIYKLVRHEGKYGNERYFRGKDEDYDEPW